MGLVVRLKSSQFVVTELEGERGNGVVEVVRPFYPDPADPSAKRGMVDVKPLMAAKQRVTLAAMRGNPELANLSVLKQSRHSVCPISEREWAVLCRMAGIPV